MLVLTRKSGESIRIGNEVRIIVLDIKDHQIRLGIEAPSDVSIHREEVYCKIEKENVKASEVDHAAFLQITQMMLNKGTQNIRKLNSDTCKEAIESKCEIGDED